MTSLVETVIMFVNHAFAMRSNQREYEVWLWDLQVRCTDMPCPYGKVTSAVHLGSDAIVVCGGKTGKSTTLFHGNGTVYRAR